MSWQSAEEKDLENVEEKLVTVKFDEPYRPVTEAAGTVKVSRKGKVS